MSNITTTQKELLKELANIIQKLAGETEKNDIFNSFIASLGIFNNDLLETFHLIVDNIED